MEISEEFYVMDNCDNNVHCKYLFVADFNINSIYVVILK